MYIGKKIGTFLTFLTIEDIWSKSNKDIRSSVLSTAGLRISLNLGALVVKIKKDKEDGNYIIRLIYSKGKSNDFWISQENTLLMNLENKDRCFKTNLNQESTRKDKRIFSVNEYESKIVKTFPDFKHVSKSLEDIHTDSGIKIVEDYTK